MAYFLPCILLPRIFLYLILGFSALQLNAESLEEKQALLDFITKFPPSRPLNWNETSSPCNNWIGVTCNHDESQIIAIRLPALGFHGNIPPNTISRVKSLQILSLRSNFITGHFPSDFYNLKNLSFLYLQFNNFTGPLPDFSSWNNLSVVNFSYNHFTGNIPFSLSNLSHLSSLNLANNSLSGEIPDLHLPVLQQLNLSNNNFQGVVPLSLLRFPNSAFVGNNVSLGTSFPVTLPCSEHCSKSEKHDGTLLLGIIIVGSVLCIAAFFVFIYVLCSRRKDRHVFVGGKLEKGRGEMSPENLVSRNQDANNKLVFFDGCNYAFDLEDLLRASAEVLGKGTFGAAYKAILEDSIAVVVKRLKEVAVGKKDFEQHMDIVASLKHENVVELKAYYYSKDEKLMVYDYYSQGSVSALLHGKRGEDRVALDWDTRINTFCCTFRLP